MCFFLVAFSFHLMIFRWFLVTAVGETLLIHKKNTTIKLVYNWKLVGVVENVHCSNLKEISSSEGSWED